MDKEDLKEIKEMVDRQLSKFTKKGVAVNNYHELSSEVGKLLQIIKQTYGIDVQLEGTNLYFVGITPQTGEMLYIPR